MGNSHTNTTSSSCNDWASIQKDSTETRFAEQQHLAEDYGARTGRLHRRALYYLRTEEKKSLALFQSLLVRIGLGSSCNHQDIRLREGCKAGGRLACYPQVGCVYVMYSQEDRFTTTGRSENQIETPRSSLKRTPLTVR